MGIISWIGDEWNAAFDKNNSGFLDGNWDHFQLGVNRVLGIVPHAISNNISVISEGGGKGINNLLQPFNPLNNPVGPFFIIGGILIIIIGGYVGYKVLKYL